MRRSTVPVLITRFSQPIENTQRVFLALSDRKISANALRQTLGLTKILSEALKSPVQVMQVFPEPTKSSSDMQSVLVNSKFPIQQVQGNPIRKISASLKTNDLLILVESTHRFGQPTLGREPEAIARSHPKTSMMIMHFPDLF